MFFLLLGFIYLFIYFNLLNFYPVTRFLVTRYCVTLFTDNLSRNSCIQEFRSVGAWNVTFCAQFACRLTSGQSGRTKEPLARPGAFKQSGHFL